MSSPVIGSIAPAWEAGLTDDDRRILEQMAAEEWHFHRLYVAGEVTEPSQSEADLKLALMAARHTRDPEQVKRIMETSPLARVGNDRDAKWTKNRSYLDRTVATALRYENDLQFVARELKRAGRIGTAAAKRVCYSDRDILTLPDPEWLIDGLLLKGGLAQLVGRHGAGKSFVALDWAMHIAAGMAWQGRKVRRGRVLYVYGEGSLKGRVAAWRTAHGVAAEKALGVVFTPELVNLLEPESVGDLLSFVGDSHPALIVLDTQSRVAPGNENESDHGSAVVDACGRIQRETDATVLLLHHTPWDLDKQRPKGSSKIPDASDSGFLLENKDGKLTLTNQKQREEEQSRPIYLKLTKLDGSLVVDADTPPPSHADRVVEALKANTLTTRDLADLLDIKYDTARKWAGEARREGRVTPGTDKGTWRTVDAGNPARDVHAKSEHDENALPF